MRRSLLSLLVVVVATGGALGVALIGSAMHPSQAQAHADCADYWRHSGHTDNVRWYHCHEFSSYFDGDEVTFTRVHICGGTHILHGISVAHHHRYLASDFWTATAHAHDTGGEGC